MIIVAVYVNVKPDSVDAFVEATVNNAKNSIKEPGIVRFDFVQQSDDPASFLLVEAYKSEDAIARHKETQHYAQWRSEVESMMAQPRKSVRYTSIFPDDALW
ncbi:MAG: antibiotic biosynthesis monooxygenase [Actinobacteria bacterium]|nr:antibiotic biosynthesis monooxygenase [Actinomycetota bacterium]